MKLSTSLTALALIFTTSANAVTFDEMLNRIVKDNLSLVTSNINAQADLIDLRAENNLPDPELELSYQWGYHHVGNKFNAGISQSFEWPGVYQARSRAAELSSNAMDFLNESNRLDVKIKAKTALIDFIGARREMGLLTEIDSTLHQLIALYDKALSRNEISVIAVNKLTLEHVEVSHLIHAAKARIENARADVAVLCPTFDSNPLLDNLEDVYPVEPFPTRDEFIEAMRAHDPTLKANALNAMSQEQLAIAAKRSRLPGFSVGYLFSREQGETFNGVSLGITLPFFSSRNKDKAANLRAQASINDNITYEAELLASYDNMSEEALNLKEEIQNCRPVFEGSNNLAILKRALDGGQISLIDYLQEVNFFLDAHRAHIDDIYRYHLLLAQLNRYRD